LPRLRERRRQMKRGWLCSSVVGSRKCFPAALRNYIVLRMPKPLDVLHGNQMGDFVPGNQFQTNHSPVLSGGL
jgi:hypothetical protein